MSIGSFTLFGVTYDIVPRTTPKPAPTPTPTPTPAPTPTPVTPAADVNQAAAGNGTYPLAGTNTVRGADQLIRFMAPLSVTGTNKFGVEVTLDAAGTVTAVNDRLALSDAGKPDVTTTVPATGCVLSGHDAARTWLLAHAPVGATVTFSKVATPVPSPRVGSSGKPTMGVYLMRGQGRATDIPPVCNHVRIAFAQGSPPALVNWGGETTPEMAKGLAAFRARGGEVLVSVGGAGGFVNQGDHAAFVAGIRNIEQQVPLDGLDWDVEATPLSVGDAVAISKELAQGREKTWITSFTPSGGPPVALYIDAAVRCYKAGLRVQWAQQFYDTEVSLAAAMNQIRMAMNAGLPAECVLVGMMVPLSGDNAAKYWNPQQCTDYMRAIKAAIPGIGGGVWWESARAGTGTAMSSVAGVLAVG